MGRGPSIEGRKNAADASRGKLFTKLIREITIAARSGGADPASNARLRAGIDKALTANMTKDTIERALKRASGEDAAKMEEIRYEGYGPSGVALIIDCMTDNSQRTVADVRSALSKHGGNLGTSGSVAFQFKHVGEFLIDTSKPGSEDKLLEAALDAGADDVQSDAGESIVIASPENFEAVKKALVAAGFSPSKADVIWRPDNRTPVNAEVAETLRDLLDKLDDLDDVQNVFHNAELAA
ncbi:MAG: YebC/PmpR family DNA-binding transcriptional regulator [Xanthomonadales bacterium PRO7]|jgi:YebC/PmpR family DNA-binding regulatory protein|nr:YebC/PmpR family DNA-binding transcriptional regulator [Xanthomonadales bacterium PRO7]HMM56837.1 YebC/PmpR family DNA-binding transcriptional regulator [Rudaea sp.]